MSHVLSHWYNAKRSKEERTTIRRFLRLAGIDPKMSDRMRDWSIPHIITFLENNKNDKT